MPRLALAFLLSCLLARGASAQPGAAEFPSEHRIRADGGTFVAELCKSAPAACPEAKKLLSDYKAALASALACVREKCESKRLKELSRELWKLDEAEHMLPFFAGREDRPLLRLSVLASARLAEAGVKAGDAKAAEEYSYRPEQQAPKVVEAVCLEDAGSCATFRAILPGDREIKARIVDCRKAPCAFETLDPLFLRARRSLRVYLRYKKKLSVSTLPLFAALRETTDGLTGLLAANVQGSVARLRAGIEAAETSGGGPDVKALESLYRRSAIGTDRLSEAVGTKESKALSARREEVNVLAAKLAALKARSKAAEMAGFLGEVKPALAAAPATAPAAAGTPASAVPYRKLDAKPTPSPNKPLLSAPPIMTEPPSAFQLLRNASSKDPVVQTDALRRLGLTNTVGDPGRLAKLAYHQAGPATCAVASQLQVLRARGLLPDGDQQKQEKALAEEAERRGFFDEGTPAAYSGSILVEKGMTVSKHIGAKWEQLEAAVSRGSLVEAGVDARYLWDLKSEKAFGHSILVTGAETSKLDGSLLGVYINDSGTDPAGAGRFVPIAQFRKAWEGLTHDFIEVHR